MAVPDRSEEVARGKVRDIKNRIRFKTAARVRSLKGRPELAAKSQGHKHSITMRTK